MNLCIDIGNSLIKIAVFSGPLIVYRNQYPSFEPEETETLKSTFPEIENVILCSVRQNNDELISVLENKFPVVVVFDESTAIPLENLYRTGHTLGKDRLAAVTGANNNYPGRNVLVVDAGTAITYDLVDEFNRYLGGNISPGLSLRFRALHQFTGKLPLVSPKDELRLVSDNTEDAISSGVLQGMVFEIDSYVESLRSRFSDLMVILTGGDIKYFDKKLKSTIFVDPDLVFTGLNRILTHNVKIN